MNDLPDFAFFSRIRTENDYDTWHLLTSVRDLWNPGTLITRSDSQRLRNHISKKSDPIKAHFAQCIVIIFSLLSSSGRVVGLRSFSWLRLLIFVALPFLLFISGCKQFLFSWFCFSSPVFCPLSMEIWDMLSHWDLIWEKTKCLFMLIIDLKHFQAWARTIITLFPLWCSCNRINSKRWIY